MGGTGLIIGQVLAGWSLIGFRNSGMKQAYKLDNALHENKKFKKYNELFASKLTQNKEFQEKIDEILGSTKIKLSAKEQEQLKLLKELLRKEENKLIAEKNILKIAAYDLNSGICSYRVSVLIKNLNKNLAKDPTFIGDFGITVDNSGLPVTKSEDGLQEIYNQISFLNEKKKYILTLLGGYPSEKEYFGRQKKSVFDEDNKELIRIVKAIKTLEQKQDNILAKASKEKMIEQVLLIEENNELKKNIKQRDDTIQKKEKELKVIRKKILTDQKLNRIYRKEDTSNNYQGFSMS